MKYDKVIIKQIPDVYASMTGLDKHNRSKMPKTIEFLQVGIGTDGRYITGIDEDSMAINSIADPLAREEKRAEIKELREYLQRANGNKDLTAFSPFWETFGIHLSSDSDLILNKTNALHVIMYHALVANGYAAPDRDSASLPEYRNAKYYAFVAERADEEQAVDKLTKARASRRLLELYENPDRMLLVGQYLEGEKYKAGMTPKTLFNMLSTYAENPREPENLKRFMKAAELDAEDLQFKITIDRAIKRKVIQHKGGMYQRGASNFGKTPVEVYQNLRKPEFAMDFLQIKDEIDEA